MIRRVDNSIIKRKNPPLWVTRQRGGFGFGGSADLDAEFEFEVTEDFMKKAAEHYENKKIHRR